MEYIQQPGTIEEQVALLQCNGLEVVDPLPITKVLNNISYFRLTSYLNVYEDRCTHYYKKGTTIEKVIDLYELDRDLRLLVFSAIQDFEIALRTRIIQYFSIKHGSFWFMNASLFNDKFIHKHCLDSLERELNRSNEAFIADYFRKYKTSSYPPAWKTLEVASFGTLSNLYCNFSDNGIKKDVANSFNLPHQRFLESWLQAATVLRNACAHHVRIWNRRFALKPQMPQKLPGKWITPYQFQPIKLYPHLCYLAYLERSIIPNSNFIDNLKGRLSKGTEIDFHAMGFPKNWEKEPLWSSTLSMD